MGLSEYTYKKPDVLNMQCVPPHSTLKNGKLLADYLAPQHLPLPLCPHSCSHKIQRRKVKKKKKKIKTCTWEKIKRAERAEVCIITAMPRLTRHHPDHSEAMQAVLRRKLSWTLTDLSVVCVDGTAGTAYCGGCFFFLQSFLELTSTVVQVSKGHYALLRSTDPFMFALKLFCSCSGKLIRETCWNMFLPRFGGFLCLPPPFFFSPTTGFLVSCWPSLSMVMRKVWNVSVD